MENLRKRAVNIAHFFPVFKQFPTIPGSENGI